MKKIGVIGCGTRMSNLLADFVKQEGVTVAAIADTNIDEVKNRLDTRKIDSSGIRFCNNATKMLDDESLDGVMIGTRCSTHTSFAIEVMKRGLYLFLEKPVSTTEEDVLRLEEAVKTYRMQDKVLVSFPLRLSDMCRRVKEIIDSGAIGEVEHVVAVNYPNYARGYFHKWYRDAEETGGMFLQKATHDLDYINYLLDLKPVCLCAMNSKQIFKGDKPANYKCADCPERDTCPESDKNVISYGGEPAPGEYCCFSVDVGIEDSGSVLVEYENGMHVVYSQDFVSRKRAAARGARIIGYKGSIEFDWPRSYLKIYYHNEDRVEEVNVAKEVGHEGGDGALMKNFAAMVCTGAKPEADIQSGILSAKMCLLAKKSAKNHQFYQLEQ